MNVNPLSKTSLENLTKMSLDFLFKKKDKRFEIFNVLSNCTVAVPISVSNHEFHFRPHNLKCYYSQYFIDLEQLVFSAKSEYTTHSILCHSIDNKTSYMLYCSISNLKPVDSCGRYLTKNEYLISFYSPISIENALPVNLKWRIFVNEDHNTSFISGELLSGKCEQIDLTFTSLRLLYSYKR